MIYRSRIRKNTRVRTRMFRGLAKNCIAEMNKKSPPDSRVWASDNEMIARRIAAVKSGQCGGAIRWKPCLKKWNWWHRLSRKILCQRYVKHGGFAY